MTARTIEIAGTHYEMGFQHGQQVIDLRPLLLKAINARYYQLTRDNPDASFFSLMTETIDFLGRADSATYNMIRGLANGLRLPFQQLLEYNVFPFLRDILGAENDSNDEGCTTWAATGKATSDNTPILVKNRDYNLDHLPLQIMVHARPVEGYSYSYITSAGSPGVFVAGMNEMGLAVVDTHAPSLDIGPGLPTYALSMHVLENHDNVRSALDYLQSVPRLGRNNLLLADASGDLANFEMGYANGAIIEANGDVLVNTNHFNSPIMQPYFVDLNEQAFQGNSFARYALVEDALREQYGRITPAWAKKLMEVHSDPLASICRHEMGSSLVGTISTTIFLPHKKQIRFYPGVPCQVVNTELIAQL